VHDPDLKAKLCGPTVVSFCVSFGSNSFNSSQYVENTKYQSIHFFYITRHGTEAKIKLRPKDLENITDIIFTW